MSNFVGTNTGYIYDAGGIRVAKVNLNQFSCNLGYGYTTTDSYVLGLGGEQIAELGVTGGASVWAHTNVFSGGGLLATYSPTGDATGSMFAGSGVRTSTYFALNDWLGTKRAEVGANGCVSTYASMPFGGGLTPSGNCTDPTEHHFTGKEHDAETGNDYFAARYFNSAMGRWMSPDWADKPEDVPYASLDNPQSLNLYGYVGNNPLGRADADGHCCQVLNDFFSGWGGAVGSDIAGGLTPRGTPDSTAGRIGAVVGDIHAVLQGGLEVMTGAGGEVAGVALDATGVGAIPGVALNVGSAVVAVHGVATAGAALVAMAKSTGSYTNTHASGTKYHGKDDEARAAESGKAKAAEHNDPLVHTDHTSAPNDREAFKEESRRLQKDNGAKSSTNYNKIDSPGTKYRQQDGSH